MSKYYAQNVKIKPQSGGLCTNFGRLEVSAPTDAAIMEALWQKGYRNGWVLVEHGGFFTMP